MDATDKNNDSIGEKDGLMIAQIQPIKSKFHDFVLHFDLSERISRSIKNDLELLKEKIKNTNFKFVFLASDGDTGSQEWHNDAFELYKSMIRPGCGLYEILDNFKELTFWPISDWFHLLKNERDKIFHNELYLNENTLFVDPKKISKSTKYKRTISDSSDLRKLKDSYGVDMFSLSTVLSCLILNDFIESAFILPFALVSAALYSKKMKIESRLQLISKSFEFFSEYLKDYPKTDDSSFLRENKRGDQIKTTLFSQNKIKRILNTLIGYSYALIHFLDFLALDRIGSHPIECFFGSTRILLNNDNRLSHFIQTFNKIQIQKRFIDELGLKHPIKRFNLNAGVHLNASEFINFNVDLESYQIYSILKNTCETKVSNDEYQKLTEEILKLLEFLTTNNDIPKCNLSFENSGCMIQTRLHQKKRKIIFF